MKGNIKSSMTQDKFACASDEYDTNKISYEETSISIHQLDNHLQQNLCRKVFVSILLFNRNQNFELDCGSPVTVISLKDYDKLKLSCNIIECPRICFCVYNRKPIYPVGYVCVNATYKNTTKTVTLFIINENYPPVLGRVWIHVLKIIDLDGIDPNEEIFSSDIHLTDVENLDSSTIAQQFPHLFSKEIGKIPNVQCTLKLKEGAQPIYRVPRPVPYALLPRVNAQLDKYEQEGIITPIDYCPWGTPLVISPKPNGGIRICGDYKVTVNKLLEPNHYPIPRVEELFTQLHGSTYFCIIDFSEAYLHIELDKESSKIAALSTHRGTYCVNRLFYSIASAPGQYHSTTAPILDGLEGCIRFFDDCLIYGKSKEECRKRLLKALERFNKFILRLNQWKSKFFLCKIKYLGYVISERGLEKDPEKVAAILRVEPPEDIKELQSFLGLVQFYSLFIPDAATTLRPLYDLLNHNTPYRWSEACNKAFNSVKKQLTSDEALVQFDPSLPLYVETDASPYGLGAILSHKIDNKLRPIGYYSRSLSPAEKNYAHIDREATTIFWATKKLFQFLYGHKFTLITDNKPLQHIFNPDKNLPSIVTQRLIHYALHLCQFDYIIQYRPAKNHVHVDYLSRNPLNKHKSEYMDEADLIQEAIIRTISVTVTVEELKKSHQRR